MIRNAVILQDARDGLRGVIAVAILLLATAGLAVDVPYLTGRVVDNAEILSPQARDRIAALMKAHEDKSSDQIAVLTGLKEGDQVVSSGQLKLQNGSHVVVDSAAVSRVGGPIAAVELRMQLEAARKRVLGCDLEHGSERVRRFSFEMQTLQAVRPVVQGILEGGIVL